MDYSDGSKADFLIGEMVNGAAKAPTIDLLLGAIGAALQMAVQEATKAAPEREVAIFDAVTAAAPEIVDTAMDYAFVVSGIGAMHPHDYHKTLLRDTANPLCGAALRAGQKFK